MDFQLKILVWLDWQIGTEEGKPPLSVVLNTEMLKHFLSDKIIFYNRETWLKMLTLNKDNKKSNSHAWQSLPSGFWGIAVFIKLMIW